jgi:type VI secretion system Hcp family effector
MKTFILSVLVALGALSLSPASAEDKGYMRLSIEGIGEVKGDATAAGREGAMEIWGWDHKVISPRDASSAQATGRRTYEPIVIRKRIDKSSPVLARAFREKLKITSLTLELPDTSASASEEQYFTIRLENANISSIRQENGTEEIGFGYDRMHRLTAGPGGR